MSASKLLRSGGAVLLIAGLLGVLGWLLSPNDQSLQAQVDNPLFTPAFLAVAVSSLLAVIALPAAYSLIARSGGWAGLVGFSALMAAFMMLGFFLSLVQLTVLPWIVTQPIPATALEEGPPAFGTFYVIATLLSLIGAVLFGYAIVRSRDFARGPGYPLIASGLVGLIVGFAPIPDELGFLFVVAPVLSSLAIAWLGYEVWRSAPTVERPAERPVSIDTRHDEAA